jgi:hypothetical protein
VERRFYQFTVVSVSSLVGPESGYCVLVERRFYQFTVVSVSSLVGPESG